MGYGLQELGKEVLHSIWGDVSEKAYMKSEKKEAKDRLQRNIGGHAGLRGPTEET